MEGEYIKVPRSAINLRGIVAVGIGVAFLSWTTTTTLGVLYLLGILALLQGLLDIISSIVLGRKKERWDILGVRALLQVMIAVVLIGRPNMHLSVTSLIGGIWAASWGFIDFICAYASPRSLKKYLQLAFSLAPIGFGIFLMSTPPSTEIGVARSLGIFAIAVGAGFAAFSFFAGKPLQIEGEVKDEKAEEQETVL